VEGEVSGARERAEKFQYDAVIWAKEKKSTGKTKFLPGNWEVGTFKAEN